MKQEIRISYPLTCIFNLLRFAFRFPLRSVSGRSVCRISLQPVLIRCYCYLSVVCECCSTNRPSAAVIEYTWPFNDVHSFLLRFSFAFDFCARHVFSSGASAFYCIARGGGEDSRRKGKSLYRRRQSLDYLSNYSENFWQQFNYIWPFNCISFSLLHLASC